MANGWWCKGCKAFVEHETRPKGYFTKDICSACGGFVEWKNEESKEVAEKKIDDGGPAFPIKELSGWLYPGMSLRDWFAGQALAGIERMEIDENCEKIWNALDPENCSVVAMGAYIMADAMLDARKPPKVATGPSEGLPEPTEGAE